MSDKLLQIISDGEGLTVEFKRCKGELANNVFETVSSFSNRYGGHILLGVENDGFITGVTKTAVSDMKKNFVNTLNNPQRFTPTLFVSLEEAEISGETILWCYIPPNSQVVMFGGRIYDRRADDGDIDITGNSEMVAHIHRRKAADYSERKIFPYAQESDFEFNRLMPVVRRLAVTHRPNHPWEKMSDNEIIRSAGLYQTDPESNKSGYNLAAVLLFGHEELIRACTTNYITDAICRRENIDRYDDRLMVTTNLIDAYDRLIEFINKHTLDRFFLINGLSVSVRSGIAREIVSNTLIHREYTSAFPAKIIIERDRIITENWSLPRNPGRIDPGNFTPFPRNPILSRFFINIGRADDLGSGIRNLYQFTKIYSGGEPELIDGDVFRTIIPLSASNGLMSEKVSYNGDLSNNMSNNNGLSNNDEPLGKMSDKAFRDIILAHVAENGDISKSTAAELASCHPKTAQRVLSQLVCEGVLVATGANRNRKYTVAM